MKKKVIIFSSTGGGGHVSASNALVNYLQEDYKVTVAYPFREILHRLDFVRGITFNRSHAEDFYNMLIARQMFFLLNSIYSIGKRYITLRKKIIRKLFQEYIINHKPDLVISVIPLLNAEILAVTKELDIPFLLIPTDLDITTFIEGIQKPPSENFQIGLAFDLPAIWKRINQAEIQPSQVSIIGFPLRPEFLTTYNKETLRKALDISDSKPVILLMMGAVGSTTCTKFLQEMTKIKSPCHIIICTGRSEDIKKSLENIELPKHISRTVVGFTEKIAELMAVADLFITKSGSASVCEAIYMNLPMLLDATSNVLSWEKFNHAFVTNQGFGKIIHNKNELSQQVDHLLQNPELLAEYRKNLANFAKQPFNDHICTLIHTLITEKYREELIKVTQEYF